MYVPRIRCLQVHVRSADKHLYGCVEDCPGVREVLAHDAVTADTHVKRHKINNRLSARYLHVKLPNERVNCEGFLLLVLSLANLHLHRSYLETGVIAASLVAACLWRECGHWTKRLHEHQRLVKYAAYLKL